MCGCLYTPPTGYLAHNPGMCPEWKSNRRPSGLQASAQSTEPHQPGLEIKFLIMRIVYGCRNLMSFRTNSIIHLQL